MSRYETLHAELGKLRVRQAFAVMVPTAVATVFAAHAVDSVGTKLLASPAVLVVLPLNLHRLWRAAFSAHRTWSDRSSQITAEISDLRRRIAGVFERWA